MHTRREFLQQAGALTLGTAFLSSFQPGFNKAGNPGVQLYTFRNDMLQDAAGTLKKIATLGIKQIESAGSDKGHYYGLKPTEIKKICADLGMTVRSGHVQLDDKWQQTLDEAAEAGQEYVICSSMPGSGQTAENYRNVADKFNKAGELARKMNLKFGYHNHEYEFEAENGKVLYDILLENTDPGLVFMELDLGWVIVPGKDPIDYFTRYPGRFPLWHLKDMDLGKKHSTEFGKGGLDIKNMFDHSELSGMKYFFIEQEEYTSTPMLSMQENMDYLRRLKL